MPIRVAVTTPAEGDDDWAPLPAEEVATQESRERHRAQRQQIEMPKAAVHPIDKAQHPKDTTGGDAKPTDLAEVALVQLRERLARQRKPANPVQQAFRKASKRPEQTLTDEAQSRPTSLPCVANSADQSEQITMDGRDPREDLPWFRALPQDEQARLLSHWKELRDRSASLREQGKQHLLRAMMHGAVMSVVLVVVTEVGFMVRTGNLGAFGWRIPLLVLGTAAAACSHAIGGGAWTFALAGLVAYLGALRSAILLSPNMLFACWIATMLFGLLGLEREMLQRGGFFGLRRIAGRSPRRLGEPKAEPPKAPSASPTTEA